MLITIPVNVFRKTHLVFFDLRIDITPFGCRIKCDYFLDKIRSCILLQIKSKLHREQTGNVADDTIVQ